MSGLNVCALTLSEPTKQQVNNVDMSFFTPFSRSFVEPQVAPPQQM
jgi:hypothetical protein